MRTRAPFGLLTKLAILKLLLTTTCASAQYVGFDAFCNVPVVIAPTSQIAVATTDQMGRPIIFLDPSAAANVSTSVQFALAHECGHHVLGHTTALGRAMRAQFTREQELAADCWGAQQLARIGDQGDLVRMLVQFANQSDAGQGPYPRGRERAQAVAVCSGLEEDFRRAAGRPAQRDDDRNTANRGSTEGSDDRIASHPAHWRYQFSKMDPTDSPWIKSRRFATEEDCERSRDVKENSPDYATQRCEEEAEEDE